MHIVECIRSYDRLLLGLGPQRGLSGSGWAFVLLPRAGVVRAGLPSNTRGVSLCPAPMQTAALIPAGITL